MITQNLDTGVSKFVAREVEFYGEEKSAADCDKTPSPILLDRSLGSKEYTVTVPSYFTDCLIMNSYDNELELGIKPAVGFSGLITSNLNPYKDAVLTKHTDPDKLIIKYDSLTTHSSAKAKLYYSFKDSSFGVTDPKKEFDSVQFDLYITKKIVANGIWTNSYKANQPHTNVIDG